MTTSTITYSLHDRNQVDRNDPSGASSPSCYLTAETTRPEDELLVAKFLQLTRNVDTPLLSHAQLNINSSQEHDWFRGQAMAVEELVQKLSGALTSDDPETLRVAKSLAEELVNWVSSEFDAAHVLNGQYFIRIGTDTSNPYDRFTDDQRRWASLLVDGVRRNLQLTREYEQTALEEKIIEDLSALSESELTDIERVKSHSFRSSAAAKKQRDEYIELFESFCTQVGRDPRTIDPLDEYILLMPRFGSTWEDVESELRTRLLMRNCTAADFSRPDNNKVHIDPELE